MTFAMSVSRPSESTRRSLLWPVDSGISATPDGIFTTLRIADEIGTLAPLALSVHLTMVRVWYEPPPYGPMTDLNRPGYGAGGGGTFRKLLEKMAKQRPMVTMVPCIAASLVISYIPLSKLGRCK